MSRLLGWLACLGTPKSAVIVYVDDYSKYRRDLHNMFMRTRHVPLERYVLPNPKPIFFLSKEDIEVRELWSGKLDTFPYYLRKLKQLPKHFKIGSVVFLWDDIDEECLYFDSTQSKWYIKSYIDGMPELDNGECTITKTRFYNSSGVDSRYSIDNSDLFTYIMNNLDKVVAQ